MADESSPRYSPQESNPANPASAPNATPNGHPTSPQLWMIQFVAARPRPVAADPETEEHYYYDHVLLKVGEKGFESKVANDEANEYAETAMDAACKLHAKGRDAGKDPKPEEIAPLFRHLGESMIVVSGAYSGFSTIAFEKNLYGRVRDEYMGWVLDDGGEEIEAKTPGEIWTKLAPFIRRLVEIAQEAPGCDLTSALEDARAEVSDKSLCLQEGSSESEGVRKQKQEEEKEKRAKATGGKWKRDSALKTNPLKPPPYPTRPDLSNETEWQRLPTKFEYKLAYKIWRAVDDAIDPRGTKKRVSDHETKKSENRERETSELAHDWMRILSHWVLRDMTDRQFPPSEAEVPDSDDNDDGVLDKRWTLDDFFEFSDEWDGELASNNPVPPSLAMLTADDVEIWITGAGGVPEKRTKRNHWSKAELEAELQRRALRYETVQKSKAALFENEAEIQNEQRRQENRKLRRERAKRKYHAWRYLGTPWGDRWPRTDLKGWGIQRKNDFLLDLHKKDGLTPLDMLTWAIALSGYNPTYWVSRAHIHYRMGHYDLALGDCYRAFRLIEVMVEAGHRNRQRGLYIRVWDAIENHVLNITERMDPWEKAKEMLRRENGVNYFIPKLRQAMHHIISMSLLKMHCWMDYLYFDHYLTTRIAMVSYDRRPFQNRLNNLQEQVESRFQAAARDRKQFYFEKDSGHVAANRAPCAARDIDRSLDEFRNRLNKDFVSGWTDDSSEAIRVAGSDHDTLGVYATKTIKKGTIIYSDEPSARGHIDRAPRPDMLQLKGKGFKVRFDAQKFLSESLCENCRREVQIDKDDSASGLCDCFHVDSEVKKVFCQRDWADARASVARDIKKGAVGGVGPTRPGPGAKPADGDGDGKGKGKGKETDKGNTAPPTTQDGATGKRKRDPAKPAAAGGAQKKQKKDKPAQTGAAAAAQPAPSGRTLRSHAQQPTQPQATTTSANNGANLPPKTTKTNDGKATSGDGGGGSDGGDGKKDGKKGNNGSQGTPTPAAQGPPPTTCLAIARELFHFKSCGKDWNWVQNAMTPRWHLDDLGKRHPLTDKLIGGRYLSHNNERHGTLLSMILRDVFDMTLLRRHQNQDENIHAHEIDELLLLCGAEDQSDRVHPFSWAANIMVPFEMLLNLGVDIFTDLTFDTWVIQILLRKLQMNVVPWDRHLRGEDQYENLINQTLYRYWQKPHPVIPFDPPHDNLKMSMHVIGKAEDQDFNTCEVRADIETVYLHTGFAMFNHACRSARNARWMWDEEDGTPNRIIVVAERDIDAGEEVKIGYLRPSSYDPEKLRRLFGADGCNCEFCE